MVRSIALGRDCSAGGGRGGLVRRGFARVAAGLFIALCGFSLPADAALEERAPGDGAKPHTGYVTTSKDGLRYAWAIPKEPGPAGERAMTVLLHGTGLDHRWGFANHELGTFRPNDVVISVDGTSPGQGGSRLFLDQKKDLEAFRAFLAEMRTHFAVDRVFLSGHSQGGFFVALYAGAHPETVSGVVAHASGAWAGSKTSGGVRDVPIVFLHGTADPVVPYSNSTGSCDHYRAQGMDLVRLRRMSGYNHWPNAVRTAECITWCAGMVTENPAFALACAEELLRPKGSDGYQYRTPVDHSGAALVLDRFATGHRRAFAKGSKKATRAAKALAKSIDKNTKAHLAIIRKGMKNGVRIDGGAWLGHVLEMREDFRGVAAFEEFFAALGKEKVHDAHRDAALAAMRVWWNDAPPNVIHETAIEKIPEAFLYPRFSRDYRTRLAAIHAAADEHGIPPKQRARFAVVEAWLRSLEEGEKQYIETWKKLEK